MYQYIFPGRLESGSANAAFIGYFYVDFGLPGVFIGSFLTGVLVQFIQVVLTRSRKTVILLAVYAFLIYAFFNLSSLAVSTILLTGGVIMVFILYFAMRAMESVFTRAVSPGAG